MQLEDYYLGTERTYQPQPSDLNLHLIRGGVFLAKFKLPEDYGWSEFVNEIHIHRMFGTHSTLFEPSIITRMIKLFNKALKSNG